jgi:ankyrin repeat protein
MHAADVGQLEVMRLMLTDHAVLDAVQPSDHCTAFHCACVNNHTACAEALARAGCDVNIKDPRGRTRRAPGGVFLCLIILLCLIVVWSVVE